MVFKAPIEQMDKLEGKFIWLFLSPAYYLWIQVTLDNYFLGSDHSVETDLLTGFHYY